MIDLLERKATLRILIHLLQEDLCITDFIRGEKFEAFAGQGAITHSLNNLKRLKLIDEYEIRVGSRRVKQINYKLTEKGKDIAELVLKMVERLEQS